MVNLVLDCIAVFVFGMGIKGAALSTTIAQWAGLTYLVHQVRFVGRWRSFFFMPLYFVSLSQPLAGIRDPPQVGQIIDLHLRIKIF